MKINGILIKTIVISLISIMIMYATGLHFNYMPTQETYHKMSTLELQVEVEALSQQGVLPFDMEQELIKRWTEKRII